jgi:hypothetical protein
MPDKNATAATSVIKAAAAATQAAAFVQSTSPHDKDKYLAGYGEHREAGHPAIFWDLLVALSATLLCATQSSGY